MTDPIDRRGALKRIGVVSAAAIGAACSDTSGAATEPADATSETASSDATSDTIVFDGGGDVFADPVDIATVDVAPDAPPTCILSPADIEGPFYFDADQVRRDIREDREGIRLDLRIRVVRADGCVPIEDAVVDLWLADAMGRYSGYESQGTEGEAFQRGIQVTDADGQTRFTAVFPGFYAGRTPHIHLKVHLDAATVLTTQLYFPQSVCNAVAAVPPYDGSAITTNAGDQYYQVENEMVVSESEGGYVAQITVGV